MTRTLPLATLVAVAVVAATAVGVLFERLAIRPLKNATPLSLIIVTSGASILIRGLVMVFWGKDTRALPAFSGNNPIDIAVAHDAGVLYRHVAWGVPVPGDVPTLERFAELAWT